MPRTKITTSKTAKPARKTAVKKAQPKTRSKAKSIAVDIVNDEDNVFMPEETNAEEEFFPELPVFADADEIIADEPDESVISEEIDQQKKFFSSMAEENESSEKLEKKQTGKKTKKSLGLYRRLAIRFVILTAILIVVVAYFSFSELTIFITPKGEIVNDSLLLKIYKEEPTTETNFIDTRARVNGTIEEIETDVSKEYPTTGEEFVGEEIQGEVTIINNYSRSQALVATTRLLTADNKLFRIKEAVNVPAGGSAKVDIYVDKPEADMAIGLTTFTIPGLWVGLQDKIYAKNENDFVFQQRIKKYVRASDISRANQDINDLLLTKSQEEKSFSGTSTDKLYEIIGSIESNIDAKVGEEKETFQATARGKIVEVSFSKEEAIALAKAKLTLLVPDDKELIEFNSNEVSYSLDSYDSQKGIATIKVSFNGVIALRTNTDVIVKKQLVNLNEEQIRSYLDTFSEIKEYKLNFSPSFIKKAPRLPEKIKIEIKSLND